MGGSNFWGDLIRSERQQQGITQRRLAVAARVNRSTLRAVERGQKAVDVHSMERLLGILGYELDAIKVEKTPCIEDATS